MGHSAMARLRPFTGRVPEAYRDLLGIRLPSAISQLLIDERPCFSFIETDGLRRRLRKVQNLTPLSAGAATAAACKLASCWESWFSGSFGLGGELLPQRPFLKSPFSSRFGSQARSFCIRDCCLCPLSLGKSCVPFRS